MYTIFTQIAQLALLFSALLYNKDVSSYLFSGNKQQTTIVCNNLPSGQKQQQTVSNDASSYDALYEGELQNLFDLQQYINSHQSSDRVKQVQFYPVSSSSSVKNSRSKKSKKKPKQQSSKTPCTASDKTFWDAFLQNKNMSTVLSQYKGPLPRTGKGSLARSKVAQRGDIARLKTILAYETSKVGKPLKQLVCERSGKDGGTPLHFAVWGIANDVTTYDHERVGRYKDIIEYLIQSGANVDAFDGQGFTPLQLLILHDGPKAIVRKFIDRGASLDKKSKNKKYDGWSALHFAAYNGKIKVVKQILAANNSIVNAQAANGDTPLDVVLSKIAQLKRNNATGDQLGKAQHKADLLGYKGGITQNHK